MDLSPFTFARFKDSLALVVMDNGEPIVTGGVIHDHDKRPHSVCFKTKSRRINLSGDEVRDEASRPVVYSIQSTCIARHKVCITISTATGY